MLRTAEFLDIPFATVSGAVADPDAVPEVLRRKGFRVGSTIGEHPSLLPGTELSLALSRWAPVVRPLVFSAALTDRAGGALLTFSLDAVFAGGAVGEAVGTLALRRYFIGVLNEVHAAVARRAAELLAASAVVGAVLVRDGRVLAQQRAHPADVAGRWELPGGRVEPGEGERDAVVRECTEELGVTVSPGARVGRDVSLGGEKVLRLYAAELPDDARPEAREHRALRWLTAAELDTVDWLPADLALLPAIRTLLD